jgi:hypothetical protein
MFAAEFQQAVSTLARMMDEAAHRFDTLLQKPMLMIEKQMDQQRYSETEKTLQEAKEALMGYAMGHTAVDNRPFLPCPDTDNDGVEQARVAGACPFFEGRLPWATLGLNRTDAWGNLIRYRVDANFSNSNNGFTFTTAAANNIRVCRDNACVAVTVNRLPAVLVSHGKNGFGAWTGQLTVNTVPATISNNELENIDGRDNPRAGNNTADIADTADADFVQSFPSDTFDDVVAWISPNILFNRMVAAGRLP